MFLVAGGILLLGLIGYLFVYPYDYIVRFEAKTFPGTINQTIKVWNNEVGVSGESVLQENLTHLNSTVQVGDSIHEYHWELKPITDSTTQVTVKIKDRNHSISNKLSVLFGQSPIETLSKKHVLDFGDRLKSHIKEFRVHIEGESELPATFYAYVNLKTSQHQKAGGMMDNFMLLSEVLTASGTDLNGPPMIVVNSWNREADSLDFNFCFPIVRSERLPEYPGISYKRIFSKKALKAVYNGNYITSDRAWYALLDYAHRNNIPVEETPVEVFYNNPNMGGNALTWKAEIFLPIKE
ncbi:MAG: hypothetical protein RLZZ241_1456 [Bacteroidota bacterium]